MIDQLLTILFISLFCNGLFIAMEEGMVLYFIKRPFEDLNSKTHDHFVNCVNGLPNSYKWYKTLRFILKPIMLCVSCMPSFWGTLIWYVSPHEFGINWVICVVSSVFVSSFIYDLHTKLND